eukprot:TRINITY_DN29647_c0_g1_i1.p1 TRINITY_DN29647_c0_g1~~TRINITY_DN29647_c0_g1_i1.p1  ORF type:complete len:532 (+),score=45.60 TRINITY_DN29647_c0_g1_i1:179-1774(+)
MCQHGSSGCSTVVWVVISVISAPLGVTCLPDESGALQSRRHLRARTVSTRSALAGGDGPLSQKTRDNPNIKAQPLLEPWWLGNVGVPPRPSDELLPQVTRSCIPEQFDSLSSAAAAALVAMIFVTMVCAFLAILGGARPASGGGGGAGGGAQRRSSGRGKIDCLDSLRVLLVSYVILFHQCDAFGVIGRLIFVGHWPMQFFTVLMGFVTFRNYARCVSIDLPMAAAYVARRLGRLCPAYFLALVWCMGLAASGVITARPYLAYPAQALFLQSFLPLKVCGPVEVDITWAGANYLQYGGNYVGWFTTVAVICAACFPILFNVRPRGGTKYVAMVLAAVLLLRSLPLISFQRVLPVFGHGLDFHVFMPFRLLEYIAGMLFAQLEEEAADTQRAWCGWGIVSDLCVWGIVTIVILIVTVFGQDGPSHGDFMLTGIFGLHALSCSFSRNLRQQGVIDIMLSSSRLSSFAQFSYGAFILQVPVRYSLALVPSLSPFIFPVAHLICCWIVGAVATVVLEGPCSRLVDGLIKPSPKPS